MISWLAEPCPLAVCCTSPPTHSVLRRGNRRPRYAATSATGLPGRSQQFAAESLARPACHPQPGISGKKSLQRCRGFIQLAESKPGVIG